MAIFLPGPGECICHSNLFLMRRASSQMAPKKNSHLAFKFVPWNVRSCGGWLECKSDHQAPLCVCAGHAADGISNNSIVTCNRVVLYPAMGMCAGRSVVHKGCFDKTIPNEEERYKKVLYKFARSPTYDDTCETRCSTIPLKHDAWNLKPSWEIAQCWIENKDTQRYWRSPRYSDIRRLVEGTSDEFCHLRV